MAGTPTRWGICTAGTISYDFSVAVRILPRHDHQLAAVAARNLERAQEFAKKFEIPKAYGSYEELANDPGIDIVYVASINTAHVEHCKMMLNAGKHVLCEKPLAMNTREVKEILELAKQKKLFFMEAFWTRFFPAIHELKNQLDSGVIGEPMALTAEFGVVLRSERVLSKELGGGAVLDLGCYLVFLSQFVFQEKPSKVVASGHLFDSGVDNCSTTSLLYSKDRIATLTTSMSCQYKNSAMIHGTKGTIEVPRFPHANQLILPDKTLDFDLPVSKDGPTNFGRSEGLSYEAEAVRQCLLKGETENELLPHSLSLTMVEIRDAIREQLGVVFTADNK